MNEALWVPFVGWIRAAGAVGHGCAKLALERMQTECAVVSGARLAMQTRTGARRSQHKTLPRKLHGGVGESSFAVRKNGQGASQTPFGCYALLIFLIPLCRGFGA
jgi:hypothetical protein